MRTIIETMGKGDELVIMVSNIDERAIRHNDPATLTAMLALAKSEALRPKVDPYNNVIVTSDTVVVHGHCIRERPEYTEEAREMLESYRDRPVLAVTSVAISWQASEKRERGHKFWDHIVFTDHTTIGLRGLTDEVIDQLILDGIAMRSAGAVSVAHELYGPLIKYVIGDASAAAGLPIHQTRQFLEMVREKV